jgi:hypothetical protein
MGRNPSSVQMDSPVISLDVEIAVSIWDVFYMDIRQWRIIEI